ncbi:hypothetical protein TOPH_07880 [Tolypocladium ophioglossoides CBS 100239]|uniref:SMP-30/Gluconolactonase/LRE-like region domain-containing protein n=1 Tax=Tolypocladium ophioglossoides (strain CBS 100239) TaxID=1163406 RepID=A0A0L0MZV9_TOLOC|nr:hypothetical protein TOPH_07880 [Tolypocladium ophioglossoides CBS 100239]
MAQSDSPTPFTALSKVFGQAAFAQPGIQIRPEAKSIRAMVDSFGRPNGICFSPDEEIQTRTMTVSRRTPDAHRASRYAFDLAWYSNEPFLTNRRLFAMADSGIPDGIKCDVHGNVNSGCGDSVNIWSPGGILLGKFLVEVGAANFSFGRDGECLY